VGYADAELLLVGWLGPTLAPSYPTIRCVTDVPANLADVLPLVQVTRFGGSDDVPTLDRAHVDVDCFAATRQGAHDLAEAVRALLRFYLPGRVLSGAVIAKVITISGPAWRPWDNTDLARFGAAYALTIHRA
jgi:hypothetical protein